jgi:DNA-directed RNA polymerase specialized sigma24 family protein
VVAGASLGEEWAWNALHRDLSPALRGYAAGVGAADPDGAVGEALVRLARDLAGAEATADEMVVWAFRHLRAVLRTRDELEMDGADRVRTAVPPLVAMALANLAPDDREALVLRVTCHLDEDACATVLGCGPEVVRARVHRALDALAAASR